MGISVSDFWSMSPRAIMTINKEMARRFQNQLGPEKNASAAPAQRSTGSTQLRRLPRP